MIFRNCLGVCLGLCIMICVVGLVSSLLNGMIVIVLMSLLFGNGVVSWNFSLRFFMVYIVLGRCLRSRVRVFFGLKVIMLVSL